MTSFTFKVAAQFNDMTTIQVRKPAGAPGSAGGQFTGRERKQAATLVHSADIESLILETQDDLINACMIEEECAQHLTPTLTVEERELWESRLKAAAEAAALCDRRMLALYAMQDDAEVFA